MFTITFISTLILGQLMEIYVYLLRSVIASSNYLFIARSPDLPAGFDIYVFMYIYRHSLIIRDIPYVLFLFYILYYPKYIKKHIVIHKMQKVKKQGSGGE